MKGGSSPLLRTSSATRSPMPMESLSSAHTASNALCMARICSGGTVLGITCVWPSMNTARLPVGWLL